MTDSKNTNNSWAKPSGWRNGGSGLRLDLSLRERRPLWQDMVLWVLACVALWAVVQVGMNWGAYSQVWAFRANELRTSVVMAVDGNTDAYLPEVRSLTVTETPLAELRADTQVEQLLARKRGEMGPLAHRLFGEGLPYPSDNRIIIPRIGKNVPLIEVPSHSDWTQLEENIQEGLRKGVAVHPISREPDSFGNFFLTGHSSYYFSDEGRFKDVFALLHDVEDGDLIQIFWEGKQYDYRITSREVVKPTEVGVMKQPKDRREITLMTCTPIGTTTNRLILKGEPVEGEMVEM